MPQTSINAYVISVDIRKKKTLLVEGSSDKRIIQRIAANDPRCSTGSFVIDTAEFIKCPEGSDNINIGNKSKVLDTYSRLQEIEKFAVLVDREWEGLRNGGGGWLEFELPPSVDRKLITSGHSIENYSFEPDFFSEAIISRCYEFFSADKVSEIEECFSKCLLMALSLSEVLSDARMISKSSGIFRPSDFTWTAEGTLEFNLESGLLDRMTCRSILNAGEILERVNPKYEALLITFEFEPVKLYLHGHIGEEVVRAAVAAKIVSLGVPEESALIFFTEGKEVREGRLREFYSKLDVLPESLAAVLDFLAA